MHNGGGGVDGFVPLRFFNGIYIYVVVTQILFLFQYEGKLDVLSKKNRWPMSTASLL